MFDFNNMSSTIRPRSEFKYWFQSAFTGGNHFWDVVNQETDECVGTYTSDYLLSLDDSQEGDLKQIKSDFLDFQKTRPEASFGQPVNVMVDNVNHNSTAYDIHLAGAILISADTDDIIPKIESCLQWLHSTDFYEAPGSTKYHDSVVGGLVYHHLVVANQTYGLLSSDAFSSVKPVEAIIVALVHDWCKIFLYERYRRNVKNEETDRWEKVDDFRYRDTSTLSANFLKLRETGHGDGSVELARCFIKLNSGMRLAIKWHMGRWNVSDSEFNSFQWSNANEPLVLLIQFADNLSITNYIDK